MLRFRPLWPNPGSMVLSSLSDSWHYPCSVENVQEMAAPSEMCWANEELKSPVGKKAKSSIVWLICPFSGRPITSGKLVGQTEEFCQSHSLSLTHRTSLKLPQPSPRSWNLCKAHMTTHPTSY